METESPEIHYIPKEALIPVKIGAGFLQRCQKMLMFMLIDRTPEEMEELKQHLTANTVPEDTWMYHYQTIQGFVMSVEQEAIDQHISVLKPMNIPE